MISKCNIFKGNSEMWALFKVPISLKCGHPEIAHNKFFISINHKDWIINEMNIINTTRYQYNWKYSWEKD